MKVPIPGPAEIHVSRGSMMLCIAKWRFPAPGFAEIDLVTFQLNWGDQPPNDVIEQIRNNVDKISDYWKLANGII